MTTATLSFRTPLDFAEQTKALASVFNMSGSGKSALSPINA
jgi:hypothetical protein